MPEGLRVKAEEAGPVWERDKVVVGEIVGVDRHPDADRLTLRLGDERRLRSSRPERSAR